MEGLTVAISVSDAPDRARLGLPAREVDRAVLTICTALVREGADILYAGNLSPDQYTFKIFRHIAGAYAGARERTPFLHLVPEPIARRVPFEALLAGLRESGAVARTRISIGGELAPVRASGASLLLGPKHGDRVRVADQAAWEAWLARHAVSDPGAAYTAARQAMAAEAHARVALGGKMGVLTSAQDQYEGAMPGIAEEAILTLDAARPLVVLGAFGGAGRDVAIALGLLPDGHRVPRGEQQAGYAEAMARVADLAYRVPAAVKPALEIIADDDRGEPTAFAIVNAILDWRAAR
jgi:hypothetical protein